MDELDTGTVLGAITALQAKGYSVRQTPGPQQREHSFAFVLLQPGMLRPVGGSRAVDGVRRLGQRTGTRRTGRRDAAHRKAGANWRARMPVGFVEREVAGAAQAKSLGAMRCFSSFSALRTAVHWEALANSARRQHETPKDQDSDAHGTA